MKEKILQALKDKFVGFDAKTLDRIADKLTAKVTKEEEVETAVAGVTFQELADSYKDAAVTSAVSTAVKNYESKYKIKDGKPVVQQDTTPPPADPNVAALMEQIKQQSEQIAALNTMFAAQQQQTIAEERLARVKGVIKAAPEAFRTMTEQAFGLMTFKDNEAFDAYLDSVKTTAEAAAAEVQSRGGVFGAPTGGGQGGGKNIDAMVKERAEQRAASYSGSGTAIAGLDTGVKQ